MREDVATEGVVMMGEGGGGGVRRRKRVGRGGRYKYELVSAPRASDIIEFKKL